MSSAPSVRPSVCHRNNATSTLFGWLNGFNISLYNRFFFPFSQAEELMMSCSWGSFHKKKCNFWCLKEQTAKKYSTSPRSFILNWIPVCHIQSSVLSSKTGKSPKTTEAAQLFLYSRQFSVTTTVICVDQDVKHQCWFSDISYVVIQLFCYHWETELK